MRRNITLILTIILLIAAMSIVFVGCGDEEENEEENEEVKYGIWKGVDITNINEVTERIEELLDAGNYTEHIKIEAPNECILDKHIEMARDVIYRSEHKTKIYGSNFLHDNVEEMYTFENFSAVSYKKKVNSGAFEKQDITSIKYDNLLAELQESEKNNLKEARTKNWTHEGTMFIITVETKNENGEAVITTEAIDIYKDNFVHRIEIKTAGVVTKNMEISLSGFGTTKVRDIQ